MADSTDTNTPVATDKATANTPSAGTASDSNDKSLTRLESTLVRVSVFQTILAVVGILTGCIALYAALNEADAARKQQIASVLPEVIFANSYNNDPERPRFSYIVVNNGIGPGRIRSMRIRVDDKAVPTWTAMLEELGGDVGNYGQSQIAGRLVQAGETISVFETTNAQTANLIIANRNRIKREICYCSVFEDCWLPATSVTELPEPVDQCPIYGNEQFLE